MAQISTSTPTDRKFPLRRYYFEISLDRLIRGIDNVRYDVQISPDFYRFANRLIFQTILYHADISASFNTENRFHWHNEISEFKRQCHALLLHGINKAKSSREIQIDVLAQIALVKLLSEAISQQFDEAVQHLKTVIRKQELAYPMEPPLALREEVSNVIYRKDQIIQSVGKDIFQYFIDVQHELNKLRISNFGEESIMPAEIFSNPILQATGQVSGFFMIENYVLIGHRLEDPVNYNALLNLLTHFIGDNFNDTIHKPDSAAASEANTNPGGHFNPDVKENTDELPQALDSIVRYVPNIDLLFNFDKTRASLRKLKPRRQGDRQQAVKLKQRAREQKRLLNQFFRLVSKELIIEGIVAPYVMQPLFKTYCPPLLPQECLQYVIIAKARKTISRKLNRLKQYYSRRISLNALNQTIRRVRWTSRARKRRYLIRFLRDFARYHRDLRNYQIIQEAADTINLRTEAKTIRLSRENHTLYEFMLSHEEGAQARPIVNHAVLKADIRGSTAIIDQMKAKQQNPATSFSLNFFEPINNVLALYGANKIFIEGDAIILSLFEHADTPGEWYSVSRACGLAVNILLIVSRYNHRNRINRLPMLDIGIGIGFADAAPTFFYDNDNPIMISPAINKADRLSECNKSVRRKLQKKKPPFNVYLYQPSTSGAPYPLPKTGLLRYNVKGIELEAAGFQKLASEIHLQRVKCRIPELSLDPLIFHTGKFPTMSGRYQRLLIREARVPEISLSDFRVIRYTDRRYYEVCTNRLAYNHIRKYL